jgi:4-hydroxybenzoate polyprenyltransferase
MIARLLSWARLGRVQLSFLTSSVPILGGLTVGECLGTGEIVGLGLVGLGAHFFGFALNEAIDYRVDTHLPNRRGHPVANGAISRRSAWLFALLQLPFVLGIYRLLLRGSDIACGLLCLSMGLSVLYNLWSKWGKIARLAPELALAMSVGLLCLCGALTQTLALSPSSMAFALTLSLLLLLLNSVPNHLKDLKTDDQFGAKSFILATGTRVMGQDQIAVSRTLQVYSVGLQSAVYGCLVTLVLLFRPTWPVAGLGSLLTLYGGLHLRMLLGMDSWQHLRRSMPLLSGFYNYFALALFVVERMPAVLQWLYWGGALALAVFPWWLAWRMWRGGYQLAEAL